MRRNALPAAPARRSPRTAPTTSPTSSSALSVHERCSSDEPGFLHRDQAEAPALSLATAGERIRAGEALARPAAASRLQHGHRGCRRRSRSSGRRSPRPTRSPARSTRSSTPLQLIERGGVQPSSLTEAEAPSRAGRLFANPVRRRTEDTRPASRDASARSPTGSRQARSRSASCRPSLDDTEHIASLGGKPGRRGDHRRGTADLVCADGAREPRGLARGILPFGGDRPLHDLEDPAHARRSLGGEVRRRTNSAAESSSSPRQRRSLVAAAAPFGREYSEAFRRL